jgi:hypothetical protein
MRKLVVFERLMHVPHAHPLSDAGADDRYQHYLQALINLPNVSTLRAFQHLLCHRCSRHRDLRAEFLMGTVLHV